MTDFEKFVTRIHALKASGPPCAEPKMPSNYRLAINVLQAALNRRYVSRKEGEMFSIWRLK